MPFQIYSETIQNKKHPRTRTIEKPNRKRIRLANERQKAESGKWKTFRAVRGELTRRLCGRSCAPCTLAGRRPRRGRGSTGDRIRGRRRDVRASAALQRPHHSAFARRAEFGASTPPKLCNFFKNDFTI